MKYCLIVLLVCVPLSAVAQNGFNPILDEPISLQADSASAYVQGRWVALDKQSALPGPSVSEIICSASEGYCHEAQANMAVFKDGSFTLTPDSVDYKIIRWNSSEIVAHNISGICRVLNVLKFDLRQKRVYSLQTLSEPVNDLPKMSQQICNAVGMRLELRGMSTFMTTTSK